MDSFEWLVLHQILFAFKLLLSEVSNNLLLILLLSFNWSLAYVTFFCFHSAKDFYLIKITRINIIVTTYIVSVKYWAFLLNIGCLIHLLHISTILSFYNPFHYNILNNYYKLCFILFFAIFVVILAFSQV